ncbi:MAG: Ig-like domain repeat protein, partial [Candidatus Marinimicrobia bacterium]|nr:Ig-like domain repeat protein [Candidatus Neomarinimicrobiota bacterium]
AGTGDNISAADMLATYDSIWTYLATTPTGNDGTATVTIAALDYADNIALVVTGDDALVVDNTPPTITTAAPLDSAFVAHTQVAYALSETVDSGQVTWTRESGPADGASPHIQLLTAAERAIGSHTGELVNAPPLVQGATYMLEFLVFDAAGNADTVLTQSVTYDTLPPAAILTYSDSLAKEGDTVIVTVTFDEPAAATPQIGLAYAVNTIPATDMTATGDAAVWTHDVVVLAGNDGYVTVSVTGSDAAGNALDADSLTNTTVLLVDNTVPGYVLSYTDSLVKAADVTTITARFTEPVQATPTISINFAGTGDDISAADMLATYDSIWTYLATTPTGNDGTATVTIAALDYADNIAVVVTGDDALVVDNTPPTITTAAPLDSAYVAHTLVTYVLGEAIDSGQVTWTWESGPPDVTPHVQLLTASELTFGSHSGELTNAPTLVQGAAYTLEFLALDAAGNAETVQTQSVTFDTIPPAVVLTYSDTLAAEGDLVVITATFNEPTLVTPQIALAYQATSVTATAMTTTVDDTIFTYNAIIPTVNDNDGIVTITITADDRAGNGLVADSTANDLTLTIDDTPPGYVLVYSDSLVKQGDPLIITATFTESAASTPGPVISIDYAGPGAPDTASMTRGVADTIWSYTTTAPDSNDGFAIVTITGTDLAENAMVPISGSTNTLLVDNTPPTITTAAPLDSAFVAHTQVTYTLSETIDSGQVTWTWENGPPDGASPHVQPLATAELTVGSHSGELANAPALVQGVIYTLEFLALDAAGNADTVQTQSVTYDTLPPAVVLTYNDTLAAKGDTVIITATFTEVTLATPQIAFAYQATSVTATAMTATADDTIFTYNAIIPLVDGNDGTVTVTITAQDRAGNALVADSTANDTSLTIDDTPPGYVLAYSDSLVKQGDPLIITATLTEPAKSTPLISLNYADTSIDSVAMTIGVVDTIWTYETTAPDSNDGFAIVTIAGTDLAENTMVPISGSTNTLKVDNTPPTITPSSPVDSGFVRSTAVTYTLDESVDSGQVTWTRESGPVDVASPHVQLLATAERAIGSHAGVLTNAPVLVQAALYSLQFLVFDEAGNPDTAIVQSVMYDTLAPDIANAELLDSLDTKDIDSTQSTTSLAGRFSGFTDAAAGIAIYEYAIGSTQGDTDLVGWTSTASDTTDTTNTTFTATGLSLELKAWYYLMGRATDQAGNVSDTVFSDGIRIISRPAPTIAVVQNSALPAYVQIFITDTLGMANSFTVKADSVTISDSRIDTFTYSYLANHKLLAAGTLDLEVTGHSAAGDSTVSTSLEIALAKGGHSWSASSLDRRFLVQGSAAAVASDLFLVVVDSSAFLSSERGWGSYRLAYSGLEFAVPVKVLMQSPRADPLLAKGKNVQAVYRLLPGGGWEELPTVDEGNMVMAWSKRAGNFRLGPRTIFVPQTTSLHHNYPNPFNPSTRIVFDLGFQEGPEQRASVIIYNLLGQEVRTLYSGVAQAGRYELLWRGIDQRGAAVASGVYFVRLMTGAGHVEVKKMLLVR